MSAVSVDGRLVELAVAEQELDDRHRSTIPRPSIGSITNSSSRSDRVEEARRNASVAPTASSRESDGKTTMPSGTPMTPIGIWRSVNATLNAVTAPAAEGRGEAVETTNVSWVAPRPIARGAISDERLAGLRVAQVDPRARSGSRCRGAAAAGRGGGRATRRRRRSRGPSTPRLGREEHGAADDREVVDDRRERRRGEPVLGVEDARRDRAEREEDRAQQHDPRQLDGLGRASGLVEARRDQRHDHGGAATNSDAPQDEQRDEHQVRDGRCDAPGAAASLGRRAGRRGPG